MKQLLSIVFIVLTSLISSAQSDLFALLDSTEQLPQKVFVEGTFKTVRLINGYTCETAPNTDLVFSISHRFGPMNGGMYEFFGLDQSTIRFGFEYGITDKLSVAIGRSSYEKLYDGFLKYKIARQSSVGFPLTITWLSGMAIKSQKWTNTSLEYPFSARMYYVNEIFIAHKFNKHFSFQLMPALVHRNMVNTAEEQNLVGSVGIGGKYDVNNWLGFALEYYYLLPGHTADNFENSLAIGVEMETGGGHVFQVHIGNAQGMTEKAFIPETTGRWLDGDISLGFNIIRVFNLGKK